MRGTGYWGISYQLSVVSFQKNGFRRRSAVGGQQSVVSNQKEWQSAVSSIRGRDREIAPTEEGNLKFYLTFLFKCCTIKVASWSEDKPTPS